MDALTQGTGAGEQRGRGAGGEEPMPNAQCPMPNAQCPNSMLEFQTCCCIQQPPKFSLGLN
ncbi:hypothetical protein [Nostoc sp.]|uniref:hypothetical protein n=1 Tax=Nostoc sp. TaxID=1180 RepID=UPI002FF54C5C